MIYIVYVIKLYGNIMSDKKVIEISSEEESESENSTDSSSDVSW